jgi:hypothetical protein
MLELQTLQIFKELSFGMFMLWEVITIGICPLQYPPTFDNLHFKIKPCHEKARRLRNKLGIITVMKHEAIPVAMPL